MDGLEFDAWTRRRFGLAVGGAVAALAGLDATTAKKKRKKRCKRLGEGCKPGGKRKCCGQLRCDRPGSDSVDRPLCCKTAGKSCSDSLDCCLGLLCCGVSARTCQPPIGCL
jgi:hypothetical protein